MARPITRPTSLSFLPPYTRTRSHIPQRWTVPSISCTRQFHATSTRQFHATSTAKFGGRRLTSPTVEMKRVTKKMEKDRLNYKNDIGLLTAWVPHSGENKKKARKTLFKKPSRWFKFYWHWFRFRAAIWLRIASFRREHFGSQLFPKNRRAAKEVRPDKKQIEKSVAALYTDMYTHFARGTIDQMKDLCLEGVLVSMMQHVRSRDPRNILEWRAENVKPKFVNWFIMHEGLGVTAGKPICLEQAIVRVVSSQTLRKGTLARPWSSLERDDWLEHGEVPKGVVWSDAEVKHEKKVEYFVVQRKLIEFKPEDWKVWGFTHEITVDNFEAEILHKQDAEALSAGKQKKKPSRGSADKLSNRFFRRPASAPVAF